MGESAKDDEDLKTRRIPIFASEAWVDAVDEWRRRQPDLPNRSEAIRRLVEMTLDQI